MVHGNTLGDSANLGPPEATEILGGESVARVSRVDKSGRKSELGSVLIYVNINEAVATYVGIDRLHDCRDVGV